MPAMSSAPGSLTVRAARLVAALALVVASVFGLSVAAALSAPSDGGVAVVFGPGVVGDDAIRRVLAAGALPVRQGGTDNVALARIDDAATIGRLYASGAWLVFGVVIAGGCGPQAANSNSWRI